MFTGLVCQLAQVLDVAPHPGGMSLFLKLEMSPSLKVGDSVAVDGACLTVVTIETLPDQALKVSFDVSPETLQKTHFGTTKPLDLVNVEMSLKVGDSMGGHFVSGHVDGVGTILAIEPEGEYLNAVVEIKNPLARELQNYFVSKGSICIDGVSLTINTFDRSQCLLSVCVIPHTDQNTNFFTLNPSDRVNIETDILAKYVEQLCQH